MDLFLNAQVFWATICNERIQISRQKFYISETLLGWVIGGVRDQNANNPQYICNKIMKQTNNFEITDIIQKFLIQKEISDLSSHWPVEKIKSETHFVDTF